MSKSDYEARKAAMLEDIRAVMTMLKRCTTMALKKAAKKWKI